MGELNNKLLIKIKSGSRKAFQTLFETYYTSLYFYACKFVDDDIAKDIVHDVFYKFWIDRDKIEITSSLNAYLFTMVRNNCLTHIRRQKILCSSSEEMDLSLIEDEINYFSSGIDSLIQKELEKQLSDTLTQMPERCRTIFEMSRFRGLKNAEIADELGISIKSVEKQMTKSLKILRVELKEYLPLIIFIYFSGSDKF